MLGYWKGLTVAALVALAGCGGGDPSTPDADPPDAGAPDASPPDADLGYPACEEFDAPSMTISELPIAIDGDLADGGVDVLAPTTCDVVDAPFGIESAGADRVYALTGLSPGTEYVVRLDSPDDLGFYVVSGCASASGPTVGQCRLFEDAATSGAEVGRFTADAADAYVVVDYYDAGYPAAGEFTLEVYAVACAASTTCGGVTPVCADFRCVGCAGDFDCDSASLPLCDVPSHACVPGYSACTGDDAAESGDDGPAGATTLVAGTPIDAAICNSPAAERDYFRFHVSAPGEHWTISLTWSAAIDLDLEVFDAAGERLGLSYYDHPERVALTYLPVGDYYVEVDYYATSTTALSTPYTISASRVTGQACATAADCAGEWRNQLYRGACDAGACVRIAGDGAVPPGGACDSASDCDSAGFCASFYFVADSDTRMVCGNYCDGDADCAGLGVDFVCTGYLFDNFCVHRCLDDSHCPVSISTTPGSPPWARLQCSAGRCGGTPQ